MQLNPNDPAVPTASVPGLPFENPNRIPAQSTCPAKLSNRNAVAAIANQTRFGHPPVDNLKPPF